MSAQLVLLRSQRARRTRIGFLFCLLLSFRSFFIKRSYFDTQHSLLPQIVVTLQLCQHLNLFGRCRLLALRYYLCNTRACETYH